jgi:gustatory receptor
VLLGVRININDENERNEVIASALKLMNRNLEITAGGLFRLDYSLLFSASFQRYLELL